MSSVTVVCDQFRAHLPASSLDFNELANEARRLSGSGELRSTASGRLIDSEEAFRSALKAGETEFHIVKDEEDDYEVISESDLRSSSDEGPDEEEEEVPEEVERVEDAREHAEDAREHAPAEPSPPEEPAVVASLPAPSWKATTCTECGEMVGVTRKDEANCRKCDHVQAMHTPTSKDERRALKDRVFRCLECKKEMGIKTSFKQAGESGAVFPCRDCGCRNEAVAVLHRRRAKKLRAQLGRSDVARAVLSACAGDIVAAMPALGALLKDFPELKPFASAVVAPRVAPPPVVWEGVKCFGCERHRARRRAAVEARTRAARSGTLLGVCYRSQSQAAADLRGPVDVCATCEASGELEAFEPFLKLKSPDYVPEAVDETVADTVVVETRAAAPTQYGASVAPLERASTSTPGDDDEERLVCPAGHTLTPFTTPSKAYSCDRCATRIPQGVVARACRACDFDACPDCSGSGSSSSSGPAAATKVRVATPAVPSMKFVCDLDLPDGSEIAMGTSLRKSWRIKNTGDQAWPSSTVLLFVGGNALTNAGRVVDVGAVPAGETTDVAVVLDVKPNERTGRSVSYFRLSYQDAQDRASSPNAAQRTQFFGSQLWLDVIVAPP